MNIKTKKILVDFNVTCPKIDKDEIKQESEDAG